MDNLDSIGSIAGLAKSTVAEPSSASTSATPSNSVSLSKITIMHCTEGTLWAPVSAALFINIFGHGVLWFQNRNLGRLKQKWLDKAPSAPYLRTLLIYRLESSKRVPDEKNSSSERCFYDESSLRKLVEVDDSSGIQITDGVVLTSQRGWLLRFLFWAFGARTQGAALPRKIIKTIQNYNEAMHTFERVLVRYGHIKHAGESLKPQVEKAVKKDIVHQM
ncbi:hypothetical protein QFC22_006731 [Naganishia vaughanmartiniae]|uniref:Uncharacterized protein n=1 Tax=Naganishia vaughanmartiniae TaxID=1424756 RepID=A0ACC2WF94_9TREE|nr:hypothetical protein QFC22_006731 [Naganishia vaughanmartiniae]